MASKDLFFIDVIVTVLAMSIFSFLLGNYIGEIAGRAQVASGQYECVQAYTEWECRRASDE